MIMEIDVSARYKLLTFVCLFVSARSAIEPRLETGQHPLQITRLHGPGVTPPQPGNMQAVVTGSFFLLLARKQTGQRLGQSSQLLRKRRPTAVVQMKRKLLEIKSFPNTALKSLFLSVLKENVPKGGVCSCSLQYPISYQYSFRN